MYSLDFGSQIDLHDGRKRPIDCMGQILMIQTSTVNYIICYTMYSLVFCSHQAIHCIELISYTNDMFVIVHIIAYIV